MLANWAIKVVPFSLDTRARAMSDGATVSVERAAGSTGETDTVETEQQDQQGEDRQFQVGP